MSVRFAPSPTGTFHIGNLRTAWISHLFARRLGLPWVVRYEDIDGPRVAAGAREKQRDDLRQLGLVADRELLQSEAHSRHAALFREAAATGAIYPCRCSRKEVQDELGRMASAPHFATSPTRGEPGATSLGNRATAAIYNGRCRPSAQDTFAAPTELVAAPFAWRFCNPADEGGAQDFVIGRTERGEFTPAYHWACAIDDFDGQHRLLVRAADLASALVSQRAIHDWLARRARASHPYPAVFHTSLVTSDDGHRLEKRTRGVTLEELRARGINAEGLTAAFARSFDEALLMELSEPGQVWGESRPQLALSDFGLGY